MAVSRVSLSSITQGFPKSRSFLDGNSAYIPSSFESIATATPTGTTVTFSSIPSTYKHLQIRYNVIASAGGANSNINMQFNSDTGANYSNHMLWVQYAGGTVTSSATTSNTTAYANSGYGAVMNTTSPMVGIVDIIDYASTNKYKTVKVFDGVDRNGTNYSGIDLSSSLWMSTSAINTITLTSAGFGTGTTIALYGIKG